jgi:undecaprenyl-diphosphatase
MFFDKLNPFSKTKSAWEKKAVWSLWCKVVLACIPAAFIGVVGDELLERATGKDIDGWIFNPVTVAAALIVYGVLFIVIERFHKKSLAVESAEDITYGQAMLIGCFQVLSIVPGTSRSGSTILGSMLLGLSRTAGAEFSFFMAIPAMVGASGIKILGFLGYVLDSNAMIPLDAWIVLAVGCLVSFVVSLVAIRFLMDFLKKHSFASFGVYRILLGALVLLFWALR